MIRRVLGCAAVVLAALCPLPVSPTWAASPVRVMLVGDSVTQGSSGDWTWRYWLWQHLASAEVDFVGPNDGLYDLARASPGSQEYVDPAFDRDHAAAWGATFKSKLPAVHELVEKHDPDVVVEMLGINDFAWLNGTPDGVAIAVAEFVNEVRSADPTTDVVIGTLPQVWQPGVSEFNALLPGLAQSLDNPASQVVVAAYDGLVEYNDTYDVAHLSATGEVKVAAGFADALAALGVGTPYPRPLPVVANGPRQPAVLRERPGDGHGVLSWVPPPGATAEYIWWRRDSSLAEPWRRLPLPVQGMSFTLDALTDYHSHEFRLQSAKGTAIAQDMFSNTVSAIPSHPAVSGLVAVPGDHRASVAADIWDSDLAVAYVVIVVLLLVNLSMCTPPPAPPLIKDRILRAAVDLADRPPASTPGWPRRSGQRWTNRPWWWPGPRPLR